MPSHLSPFLRIPLAVRLSFLHDIRVNVSSMDECPSFLCFLRDKNSQVNPLTQSAAQSLTVQVNFIIQ